MVDIVFHPSAIVDIRLSQAWHVKESKIVADRFSVSIMRTINSLEKFPYSSPICFSNIRRVVVHGFPYNIYYQFENDIIIILAVSHSHRDPTYINDTIELRNS